MASNTDAIRDNNHIPVMLGRGDNGETLPVKIDHVTGRILAEIYITTDSGSEITTRAIRDNNRIPVLLGEADNSSGVLAAAIDARNGYVHADIIIG